MAVHEFTATCHTDGCLNDGVPIQASYDDEDGLPGSVVCGPCGQPIEDTTL